ncbi:hypothetical protein J4Q44_G00374140 [Coregonus suidteri]|uniref:C2H2-type domain-containing protein n=1 Tax=Coregonus suidteri TaxID=861788 RepID=A0AAN8KM60_9TELE
MEGEREKGERQRYSLCIKRRSPKRGRSQPLSSLTFSTLFPPLSPPRGTGARPVPPLTPPLHPNAEHTHQTHTHTSPLTHTPSPSHTHPAPSHTHQTPHTPSPLTHTPNTHTHTPNTHTPSPLTHTPSPLTHIPIMIPMATSLFSPDINTKTAYDLLIKLSAATQQAGVKPGSVVKQEPQEEGLRHGQQQQQQAGERVEPGRGEKTPPAPLLPEEDEDLFQRDLFSQDISVKMASALLYHCQAGEKVCKANELKGNRAFSSPVVEKQSTPPDQRDPTQPSTPSTPPDQRDPTQPSTDKPQHVVSRHICPVCSYQAQCQRNLNHHLASHTAETHTTGFNYYYRCHVCGFELEGRSLFLGHMTEHSEWERDAFTLRCSVCDHSTSEERAMRAHTSSHTHTPGEAGSGDYLQTHLLGGHTPKDLPDGRDGPQSGELRAVGHSTDGRGYLNVPSLCVLHQSACLHGNTHALVALDDGSAPLPHLPKVVSGATGAPDPRQVSSSGQPVPLREVWTPGPNSQ